MRNSELNIQLPDDIGDYSEDKIVFSQLEDKVTREQIIKYVNMNAGDRLKNKGYLFYDLGLKYDIDPAFAVAVAQMETSLGKATCASISRDCSNLFCIKGNNAPDECKLFRDYASYSDGIEAFYKLIKNNYVANGQDTIAKIACAPGSGFSSHCYCVDEKNTPPYCSNWIDGKSRGNAIHCTCEWSL